MSKQSVFLSRWGFHPCDKETFLKLKRLKKLYWESVKSDAAWHRWTRKEPQNRFEWDNPKGNPAGKKKRRSNRPIPEPKRCTVSFHGVLDAFEQARMPKDKPDQVKPLKLSVKKIDAMLAEAEK